VLKYSQLPSKGYGFIIPKTIIELKFRRPNGESNNQFKKNILKDILKLNRLKNIFHNARGLYQTKFWMIVFDKKSNINNEFERSEDIEFIYEYANKCGQVSAPNLANRSAGDY